MLIRAYYRYKSKATAALCHGIKKTKARTNKENPNFPSSIRQ